MRLRTADKILAGWNTLVDVQGNGVYIEAGGAGLAAPVEIRGLQPLQFGQRVAHGALIAALQRIVNQPFDLSALYIKLQLRIKVRVVCPGGLRLRRIGLWIDQPNIGLFTRLFG